MAMDNVISGVIVVYMLIFASTSNADTNDSYATATIDSPIKGHWIVDPRQAGDSLPPEGRSLFDFVFTKTVNGKVVYDIPFPYSKLIQKLQALVQDDDTLKYSVKQVLIPLGRSLARNIARPDFFRYPRVVSVIDTEPRFIENDPGLMLKDRLYIGYGEAAEILEIISYNETAGRFEFQIVTDYKHGGQPEVFYANREVCSACHQNGALIFSRQQWDETNSNPRIAALLGEHQNSFYGIPVKRGVDIPFAIDAATDRANLFSLYQLMWQQGCKATDSSAYNEIKCREELLTYTLQYLLSNRTVFNSKSEYYSNHFLPRLTANWKQRWPDGLLIPDPDIPNRDPLLIKTNASAINSISASNFSNKTSSTLNMMLAKNDVPDKFEPLNYRSPMKNWAADMNDLDRILISGLASFIPDSDIQRLDKLLDAANKVSRSKHELSCSADENNHNNRKTKTRFSCHSSDEKIFLKGRFVTQGSRWINGKISKLVINGQTQFDLLLIAKKLKQTNKSSTVTLKILSSKDFSQQSNTLPARLPDGNSIDKFNLSWNKTSSKSKASLIVRHDFGLVKNAIAKIATLTAEKQSDALSGKPFRRATVMQEILQTLGAVEKNWCCVESKHMPVAKSQDPDNQVAIVSQAANPEIAPFYHYCSVCHRTSNRQPPNFLQGDEAMVARNINQCAERIFFRLSMWQLNSEGRAKSPMPPATALYKLGFSQRHWASSDELLSLKHAVTKLINKKSGKNPDIAQYIKTGFDNLPECLPQS